MLSETIDELPPEIKKEVLDYIEFLSRKYGCRNEQGPFKFAWAGCLSHLKDQYTAVQLQHKAAEWR